MSAIIEPESAQWWVRASSGSPIRISATSEEHSVVILRRYAGGGTEEIEIKLSELPDVEAALLNAQLWLERATKQRGEIEAAEAFAKSAAGGDPWSLCMCGHGPLDHDRPSDEPVGACRIPGCECSLWTLLASEGSVATSVTMMVVQP